MRKAIAAVGATLAAITAFRWLKDRRREDIDWHSAQPPGAIADIEGVPIHYIESGSGANAAVLIHGFLGHTYTFRHTIPELASDHRVIAVDLKGYGYSGRLKKSNHSLTEQARLVSRLMDHFSIDHGAIIGHSMGGEVAMRLAAGWPERVERLVLAASVSGDRIPTLPVTPLIKPFLWLFGRLFGRRIFRRQFYDPSKATSEVYEGYRRPLRIKGTGDTVYQTLRDGRREKPVNTSGIRQPVLILWASHERILPRWTLDRLRKRFPRAEVVTIDRAGHLLLEEQPEACNSTIRSFLTGAQVAPPVDMPRTATVS
jgi:pimeloyl-ACP methyl ester carboxylesterase